MILISYRIAQEQCCAAVLEDIACNSGISMAKDQGSCDALLSGNTCETKTAKVLNVPFLCGSFPRFREKAFQSVYI